MMFRWLSLLLLLVPCLHQPAANAQETLPENTADNAALVTGSQAAPDFAALEGLSADRQYRQLSLMLLVSAGVDDPMLTALRQVLPPAQGNGGFNVEDYATPLARIVDQASLLAGAVQLFEFSGWNQAQIRSRLEELETQQSVVIASVDLNVLREDTIIIRQAIADSMAYGTDSGLDPAWIQRYRAHTVVLRSALEFAQFKQELDRLTNEAIVSVGGRLDAYQRMFDDETTSGTFDRRIRSAELIYLPEGQFDPQAGILTEEMLENMVLMESQPHR
jgi:hypothetical protein